MIEIFNKVVNIIGVSNFLTLVIFIISFIVAYYFYFKTFYRLVYSTQTISINKFNTDKKYNTRVLVYNNGRKTIKNEQLEKLVIKCSDEIEDIIIKKSIENLEVKLIDNISQITFDFLDSSDFFVLEIVHKGLIIVEGRVEESGKILHREPPIWAIFNGIIMLALMASISVMFYKLSKLIESDNIISYLPLFDYLFLVIAIYLLLTFIHRLFFIPDYLIEKHIAPKDKSETEFKN